MKGLETIMGKLNSIFVFTYIECINTGYVAWVGKHAESDCVVVEMLYECGAVPFVRTNVPQALMASHLQTIFETRLILSTVVVVGNVQSRFWPHNQPL